MVVNLHILLNIEEFFEYLFNGQCNLLTALSLITFTHIICSLTNIRTRRKEDKEEKGVDSVFCFWVGHVSSRLLSVLSNEKNDANILEPIAIGRVCKSSYTVNYFLSCNASSK